MEKFDDTLNQLKDSAGELKDNIHMLNEIVPVDEQIKYFEYSKYIKANKEDNNLNRNYLIARLFTPEVDVDDKRHYLSLLASFIDVAAYRALEAYHKSPLEPELISWSAMALTENRILLDSELSGEKQFFVSTGLGGKGKKLRYFSVIASATKGKFSDFQIETLLCELRFRFELEDIDIEEIEIKDNYVKLLLLCGLNHDARSSIENSINEVNLLGKYVDHNFLLTNVKKIEDQDIQKFLDNRIG